MNQQEDILSLPSDILTSEEQAHIMENVGDDFEDLMQHEVLKLEEFELYPENDQVLHVPQEPLTTMTTNILSNEEYPGQFDFEVDIFPNGTKNPWVYSPQLNKVYMDKHIPFPIDFKIKSRPSIPLYIRATPVFSQPQFAQEAVYRCISHEHPKDPSNLKVDTNVHQHVMRCHNSSTVYVGDKQRQERLSLVFPFGHPQTGSEGVREMFVFVCQTSCPSPGMSRRPIEVLFTLEGLTGEILGRRVLNVRICACPKRDKETEEKKLLPETKAPQAKKRKVENAKKSVDRTQYLLELPIMGIHNAQQVLKYAQDLMAGEMHRHPHQKGMFEKCLKDLENLSMRPMD